MVLASAIKGKGAILLYESKDMEHWKYLHPLLVEESSGIRCAFYPMKLQALPFPKVYFLAF